MSANTISGHPEHHSFQETEPTPPEVESLLGQLASQTDVTDPHFYDRFFPLLRLWFGHKDQSCLTWFLRWAIQANGGLLLALASNQYLTNREYPLRLTLLEQELLLSANTGATLGLLWMAVWGAHYFVFAWPKYGLD